MRDKILNLEKLIIRTPLIPFQAMGGSNIYLKPENLQIFGSYKIRGIVNVLKECDLSILKKGLSVASAGNMAQAVAFAAQTLKIPCRIYVPETAPQNKLLSIRQLEAEIIQLPYNEVWDIVRGVADIPKDRLFIHPALNTSLLKGYSTIANEIIEDMPDVDAIVIPFGVGGLSLGVSKAIHQFNPDIAIYACEPETAAPLHASLRLNKATSIQRTPSFVDAIGTPEVLPDVFHQITPIISDSLVMPLNDIKTALKNLFLRKLVCEGAAACSLAAAIRLGEQGKYKKIVCILSGGNIDIDVFKEAVLN